MSPPIDPGKRKAAVQAFATGALALPGLAGSASADAPIDATAADYAFSYYKEDTLSPSDYFDTGTGSRDRYEIFAHQFKIQTPVTARTDATFDLVYETMSGASPWWVEPNTDPDQPYLQAMSGASIEETRVDGQVSVDQYFDKGRLGLTGGVSSENDYLSGNFGIGAERGFNEKNTTIGLAMGWSWDTITPTEHAKFNRLSEYDKKTFALDFGVSQILSRSTILRVGLAYKRSKGFLSDPYKQVIVGQNAGGGGTKIPDARPDTRHQLTVTGQLRQFIAAANAALHVDAAFGHDDWKVTAFTANVRWYQTLFEILELVPKFRYYSQSDAEFYGPIFDGTPSYATSDYRLSPYGALSYGLEGIVRIASWPSDDIDLLFSLDYERYLTSGDFALRTVDNASPGLVDYHLFGARIGGRF